MSATSIYSAVVAKAESVFSAKQRLSNPYELKDNPELITKDSWGLKVGSASREEMEFCNLSIAREFVFVLIKQFATVGSKETAFDSVSVGLMEDQQTFLNNLWSPTELGIADTVDHITIESISGIEFMQTNEKKYLFCEISFKILTSTPVI